MRFSLFFVFYIKKSYLCRRNGNLIFVWKEIYFLIPIFVVFRCDLQRESSSRQTINIL